MKIQLERMKPGKPSPWIDSGMGSQAIAASSSRANSCSTRGGVVQNDKQTSSWAVDFDEFRGELRLVPPRYPVRFTPDGIPYQPCDCTWNFGVVRTDVAREIRWDEELALLEHQDWFWRLHRHWKSAFALGVSVRHHSDRPNAEYNAARNSVLTDSQMWVSMFFEGGLGNQLAVTCPHCRVRC